MGAVAFIAPPDLPQTRSARMARLFDMARRVAKTDASVLITGESGTGKGVLARTLHDLSERAAGPFVTISCSNIPGELLESELFGHEKGAFTGAVELRRGRFEQAHGGTLHLDGIGELQPALQGKLLRVVQEKAFERLAGTRTLEVDVRLISSTQGDLEGLVKERRFRSDLLYRLNVVRLDLPPLRDRLEDLPALATEILHDLARTRGGPPQRLSAAALERLLQHDWPGNVRELRNVLESATIAAPGPEIPAEAVAPGTADDTPLGDAVRGRMTLQQLEERYIREVLRWTRGHRTEAARILGINRKTLLEKRKRYRIP